MHNACTAVKFGGHFRMGGVPRRAPVTMQALMPNAVRTAAAYEAAPPCNAPPSSLCPPEIAGLRVVACTWKWLTSACFLSTTSIVTLPTRRTDGLQRQLGALLPGHSLCRKSCCSENRAVRGIRIAVAVNQYYVDRESSTQVSCSR